jgi:hypothetical protein
MAAENRNAADVIGWAQTELLRARYEVTVAVHHLAVVVALFYVAVVGASLWWGYFELVEHGWSHAWWDWTVWGLVLASLWFITFALVLGWTQRLVVSVVRYRSRRRVGQWRGWADTNDPDRLR